MSPSLAKSAIRSYWSVFPLLTKKDQRKMGVLICMWTEAWVSAPSPFISHQSLRLGPRKPARTMAFYTVRPPLTNPDRLPADSRPHYPDLTSSLRFALYFQPAADRELLGVERHHVAKVVHPGRSLRGMRGVRLAPATQP